VGFLILFQRDVGPGIGDDWRAVEVRSGKPQLKGFKKKLDEYLRILLEYCVWSYFRGDTGVVGDK
jgi:hypothetical protein